MSASRTNRLTLGLAASVFAAWSLACAAHRATTSPPPPKQAAIQRPAATPSALLGQLQGLWAGHTARSESARWEWVIRGNTISTKTSEGDYYKGTLRPNDRTSPVQVDIQLTDCSDTSLNGQTVRGIVKIEGERVAFCILEPGAGGYPTAFDSSAGMLIIGERK